MSFQPKSATMLRGNYEWAQLAPHASLMPWVSSYWTLQTGSGRHVVRTLPDACIDLTLRLGRSPRAFVAGAQARARSWPLRGRIHLLGARMLPGAAPLLGIDPEALTDEWTPLETFLPKTAVDRLVRAVSSADDLRARATLLDAFLADRLLNRELDARLSNALRIVFAEHGDVSMTELARKSGAHTRTLTRLFERWIGLSPKRFARIVRLQAALRTLPESESWARVALDLGYCDQAHLIRDVREIFGATPGELVRLASQTR
jgi:AraC-like DNA-binding protein